MIPRVLLGPDGESVPVSSVSVSRSLEDPTSTATFTTFAERRRLLAERCAVFLGDRGLLTGIPERYPGSPEAAYNVGARSATASMVVYQADGNEYLRNMTPFQIIRSLAARIGLQTVSVNGAGQGDVKRFKLERGDTFAQAAQELGEAHGFVVTDDAQGRVRLYTAPADLAPVQILQKGRWPVLDVQIDPAIDQWVDVVHCRGERSPISSDVANAVAGQIAVDIAVGNIRPSQAVLRNKAARSTADARRLVESEIRKRLAGAYMVRVTMGETTLDVGDVVQVRSPEIDAVMIVSALTWTVNTRASDVSAVCRLPAVYANNTRLAGVSESVRR